MIARRSHAVAQLTKAVAHRNSLPRLSGTAEHGVECNMALLGGSEAAAIEAGVDRGALQRQTIACSRNRLTSLSWKYLDGKIENFRLIC